MTQTGGRGRLGRTWRSPPGNLYASTIVRLRPTDPPPPTLGFVAAVALAEVGGAHEPRVQLKWPNDLLLDGAKLAGILLERAGDAVVIGFGVNLAHSPDDLDRPTASLPGAPDPALFLEDLAARSRASARRRRDGFAPVRARWLDLAHPKGAALTTSAGTGLFETLDGNGALILRLADGSTRAIHAGDVFLA